MRDLAAEETLCVETVHCQDMTGSYPAIIRYEKRLVRQSTEAEEERTKIYRQLEASPNPIGKAMSVTPKTAT